MNSPYLQQHPKASSQREMETFSPVGNFHYDLVFASSSSNLASSLQYLISIFGRRPFSSTTSPAFEKLTKTQKQMWSMAENVALDILPSGEAARSENG